MTGRFQITCPECGTKAQFALGDDACWICDACGYESTTDDFRHIYQSITMAGAGDGSWLKKSCFSHAEVAPFVVSDILERFPFLSGKSFWDGFTPLDMLWMIAKDSSIACYLPLADFPREAWNCIDDVDAGVDLQIAKAVATGSVSPLNKLLRSSGENAQAVLTAIDRTLRGRDAFFDVVDEMSLQRFASAISDAVQRKRISGVVPMLGDEMQRVLWRYAPHTQGLPVSGLVDQDTDCVRELLLEGGILSTAIWKEYPFEVFKRSDWIALMSDQRFELTDDAKRAFDENSVLKSISSSAVEVGRILCGNPALLPLFPGAKVPEEGLVHRYLRGLDADLPWDSLSAKGWTTLLSCCGEDIPEAAGTILDKTGRGELTTAQLEEIMLANPAIVKYTPRRRIKEISGKTFVDLCEKLHALEHLICEYPIANLSEADIAALVGRFPGEIGKFFKWKDLPVARVYKLASINRRFYEEYPRKAEYRIYEETQRRKNRPKKSAPPASGTGDRPKPGVPKPGVPKPSSPKPVPSDPPAPSGEVVLEYKGSGASPLPRTGDVKSLMEAAISANATATGYVWLSILSFIICFFWGGWAFIGIIALIAAAIYKGNVQNARCVRLKYKCDASWTAMAKNRMEPFLLLSKSSRVWQASNTYRTDPKYNGGVNWYCDRRELAVSRSLPFPVAANVEGCVLRVGDCKYVFLPDCVYAINGASVEIISYANVDWNFEAVQYAEMQGVPGDTSVAHRTYKYVNKGGGPDRRFNPNPVITICRYGRMGLQIGRRLNTYLMVSSSAVTARLSSLHR